MKKIFITAIVSLIAFVANAQQLPDAKVQDRKGKVVGTPGWVDNETPFVVSFWSTTCKPCLKELDILSENYDDWNEETPFRVIAVSIDDSRSVARAKALAAGSGWDMFEVFYDVNSDFKRAMNVSMVPHVFVFDKNGKQVYSHVGYKPGDEMELFEVLKNLKHIGGR